MRANLDVPSKDLITVVRLFICVFVNHVLLSLNTRILSCLQCLIFADPKSEEAQLGWRSSLLGWRPLNKLNSSRGLTFNVPRVEAEVPWPQASRAAGTKRGSDSKILQTESDLQHLNSHPSRPLHVSGASQFMSQIESFHWQVQECKPLSFSTFAAQVPQRRGCYSRRRFHVGFSSACVPNHLANDPTFMKHLKHHCPCGWDKHPDESCLKSRSMPSKIHPNADPNVEVVSK